MTGLDIEAIRKYSASGNILGRDVSALIEEVERLRVELDGVRSTVNLRDGQLIAARRHADEARAALVEEQTVHAETVKAAEEACRLLVEKLEDERARQTEQQNDLNRWRRDALALRAEVERLRAEVIDQAARLAGAHLAADHLRGELRHG